METFIKEATNVDNKEFSQPTDNQFSQQEQSSSFQQQDAQPLDTQPKQTNNIDAELEAFLSQQKASIKVVGTGGAGNNTINRIAEVGIEQNQSL